jgi:hypothetical protein
VHREIGALAVQIVFAENFASHVVKNGDMPVVGISATCEHRPLTGEEESESLHNPETLELLEK